MIKDGLHVINFDGYKSIRIHCIVFYVNCDNVTYSDSRGGEYIRKEILKNHRQ